MDIALFLSRRLQVVAAALMVLAVAQVAAAGSAPSPTGVRGALR